MNRFVLAAICLVSTAGQSQATMITFDSLTSTNDQPLPSYSESGFDFTNDDAAGFLSLGSDSYGYAGSAALLNSADGGTTSLTKAGPGTFDLHRIDLSEIEEFETSVTVAFTGTKFDSSTVFASFDLNGIHGFETFAFTGFTDLVLVEWDQDADFHQFDNLVIDEEVTATPEPVSMALLGLTAVGGIGLRLRRMRKAQDAQASA